MAQCRQAHTGTKPKVIDQFGNCNVIKNRFQCQFWLAENSILLQNTGVKIHCSGKRTSPWLWNVCLKKAKCGCNESGTTARQIYWTRAPRPLRKVSWVRVWCPNSYWKALQGIPHSWLSSSSLLCEFTAMISFLNQPVRLATQCGFIIIDCRKTCPQCQNCWWDVWVGVGTNGNSKMCFPVIDKTKSDISDWF